MKTHFGNTHIGLMVMVIAGALFASAFTMCKGSDSYSPPQDPVTVVTLYGPSSYFEYRDTTLGYDYELMEAIASQRGFRVNWVVADSLAQAVEMIENGTALILASDVPENSIYRTRLRLCGPKTDIEQVLVQPPGDTVVVDIHQLAGRTVYVEKDSKGETMLQKLNDTKHLDINIRPVLGDSIATEDALAAVARGDIHLALVDKRTAKLNQTYYPDLNITMALSEPEAARWAVAKSNRDLASALNRWVKEPLMEARNDSILDKYFKSLKRDPVPGAKYDRNFSNGYASPFDHLFKQHTEGTTWDWRLLAAQGFTESRFDSTARSWAGAAGVMQIMPGTARQFGLKKNEVRNTSRSIQTAVKVLQACDEIIAREVADPIERQKFVMAAYNAGPGHVLDAIRLAKKYGLNSQVWDGNVEQAMLMKMQPKYYRDPVVRHGYSRGRETVDYVDRIWSYYSDVIEKVHA